MTNINFSNETTKQLLDCKNAQVEALQKDRQKNIDFLKRLIEYVENPKHSEKIEKTQKNRKLFGRNTQGRCF